MASAQDLSLIPPSFPTTSTSSTTFSTSTTTSNSTTSSSSSLAHPLNNSHTVSPVISSALPPAPDFFFCAPNVSSCFTAAPTTTHTINAATTTPPVASDRTCPTCHKTFSYPTDLAKHRVTHQTSKALTCTWEGCGKSFKRRQHLKSHVRTQHEQVYRYPCSICGKGVEKKGEIERHAEQHRLEQVGGPATAKHLSAELEELRTRLLTRSAQAAQDTRCTTKGCQIPAKSADEASVFQCGRCTMRWHYDCVGYTAEMASLPKTFCAGCLKKMNLPVTACMAALSNRRLLEAHIKQQGWEIFPVPGDGRCLPTCVATVTGLPCEDVFRAAVEAMSKMDFAGRLTEEDCVGLQKECNVLLTRPVRNMARRWNSLIFDLLPQALADSTGRQLVVLKVLDNAIKQHVIYPSNGLGTDSIWVLHSFEEIQQGHYDLVLRK